MDPLTAAVVTCSDTVAGGRAEDRSGPLLAELLAAAGCSILHTEVVPDEAGRIAAAVLSALDAGARVVVCTGGTGVGPRDVTPEALQPLLDRTLPGVGEAVRAMSRDRVPTADLSRVVAGMAGDRLLVALPGSTGGVRDGMAVVGPLLRHALDVADGAGHARGTTPGPQPLVREDALSLPRLRSRLQSDAAGAVVVFEGRVRDHDHGRPVVRLCYEGHPGAEEVLRQVLAEASQRAGVLAAAAEHRVGEVPIGELAFLAGVAAAHRGEAFDACAWLVDEVKRRLPVWKLQTFADGEQEWVNCP